MKFNADLEGQVNFLRISITELSPVYLPWQRALGGGFPIRGLLLAKICSTSTCSVKGDHGSTFGGNPLACAAGAAVMDVLLNDGLVENAEKMEQLFHG